MNPKNLKISFNIISTKASICSLFSKKLFLKKLMLSNNEHLLIKELLKQKEFTKIPKLLYNGK